jgi:hypothetical protein
MNIFEAMSITDWILISVLVSLVWQLQDTVLIRRELWEIKKKLEDLELELSEDR